MSSTSADPATFSAARVTAQNLHGRLVRSEFALLRFVAGMRAMLVLLAGIGLLAYPGARAGTTSLVVLAYVVWAAMLLWRTLRNWSHARSPVWLWLDALAIWLACLSIAPEAPLLGIAVVLPVVALALLSGMAQAAALAVVCAAALLALSSWHPSAGGMPPLPWLMSIVLIGFGPAAALLARPSRELQLRLQLLEAFNERLDPRQGLGHHVEVLLGLLADRLSLTTATISLQGLEPRIFQLRPGRVLHVMHEQELQLWRDRLAHLPRELGCLCSTDNAAGARGVALHPQSQTQKALDDAGLQSLVAIGPQALALPLRSYGQPLGHLCLHRTLPAFDSDDLRWLDDVMREALPLLERSDLLEQLQRESAAHERERIGRDLHDSAVQPYLGLKYGLEALARSAGHNNPVSPQIGQMVQMATEELETLRDVVSGLRKGQDPTAGSSASLAALQRQVTRFEALYGLKVNIFAPADLQLRGSAAKAVLHMVNESLTNVRRHTSATGVTVLLDIEQSHLVMRLRNDHGVGEPLSPDFVPKSLSERATEFGGGVAVNHESNFTEVVVTLPLLGAIG